jgi:hypothetical protein
MWRLLHTVKQGNDQKTRRPVIVSVELSYLSFRLTNTWQETPEVKEWTKKIELLSIDGRDP